MARYGRLRLEKHPTHGLVLSSTDRPVLEEVLRAKKIAGMLGARLDDDTVVVHPSERGNLKQALLKIGWPAEDFAGYVDGEAHADRAGPRTEWPLRALPARGGRVLLARRLRRRRAALRRRQDPGRRGGDGARPGDHADPRHQHRQRAAVEGRAGRAHLPDRRRDRRVLRRRQGGPAGHHRDVPGDDHPPEGRLHPPRAARRPRLGPHRVRRGAPAAGADLPDDRRPAGPPADRADRDAGPRGRPRGRRLLADRARSATTPRGRTSRRRATSRRPTASRCGSPCRTASGSPTPPPSPRSATGWPSCTHAKTDVVETLVAQHAGRADAGDRPVHRPARRARRAARRPGDQGRDAGQGAAAALRRLPLRARSTCWWSRKVANFSIDLPSAAGRHPGVRLLRLPPGGGPAAGPAAAAQGRRADARASTRSSRATPSTPTSPRTASGSSPSRATPTASSTPTT